MQKPDLNQQMRRAFAAQWTCNGLTNMALFGYVALGYSSDPETCFATDDIDKRVASSSGADTVDVGARFKLVFLVNFVGACVLFTCGFLNLVCNVKLLRAPLHIFAVLASYTITITILVGLVLRFMHSGRVCSGDFLADEDSSEGYLVTQGFFLALVLYIWLTLCAAGCCFGLLGVFLSTS